MLLFVNTLDHKTHVEPLANGTVPQYYAYCIERAMKYLKNTDSGRKAAIRRFISDMEENPFTHEMITKAPLMYGESDEELINGMMGYIVFSDAKDEEKSANDRRMKASLSVRALTQRGGIVVSHLPKPVDALGDPDEYLLYMP